ncbi:MAG: EAL domain-containing protein [Pseudomonadota bacterium]
MLSVRVRFWLIFAVALLLWGAGGHQLHRFLTHQSNLRHLEETADLLVQRVERSVDFVVIASTELLMAGHVRCSDEAVSVLRKLVLGTGTVADIFMVADGQVCSSFGGLSAALPGEEIRSGWTDARNPNYRLGAITTDGRTMLGVSWGFGTELELVSAINADSMLFDMLAEDLRDAGSIALRNMGNVIARYPETLSAQPNGDHWMTFISGGDRYPIEIEIAVNPDALGNWHQSLSRPLAVFWVVLGMLGAAALSHLLIRRHDHAYDEVLTAIKTRQIKPFFQPIVDARSNSVIGCEALARWIKPTGEVTAPGRFIPLIEDRDLNGKLMESMFAQTCAVLGGYLSENPEFYVSFNVTPRQLIRKDFVKDLTRMVEAGGFLANQLCLEITERQLLASPEAAADTTRQLRRQGFRLAIDDAGTGHNGLAALQKLEVGAVKIDKYFIDHIDDDPRSRVMVDMLVSVARRYQMTTIAEGVETDNQLAVLRATGVHAFQGYLFSKPLPGEKFVAALVGEWQEDAHQPEPAQADGAPVASEMISSSGSADPNEDEAARLEALYRLQILDTEEEEVFDRIPRMIRQALNVPMAAIALIDEDRRWFKSVAGGQRGQLARRHSFCNKTIQSADPTIVRDTLQDEGFRDNILVKDAPYIRAYLGVPLVTNEGYRIGSVCCVDKRPRGFSADEIQLVKDMSLIVMEQMEMRTLALFDPLTSARTRRGFCSEAKHQLELARLTGHDFALAMLDIDHFKSVNDRFGHGAGDEILRAVGHRISEALPPDAFFGRMGGEEFAVALPNASRPEALRLAEDLRRMIDTPPFETKWGALHVTISVGIAQANGLTNGLEELLEQADWALYEAKGKGRNRVVTCADRVA